MEINVKTNNKGSTTVLIDEFPDECPYCHRGIDPIFLHGYYNYAMNTVHLSFFCPRLDCNAHFVGEYRVAPHGDLYLQDTLLGQIKYREFSEIIEKISKSFEEIYNQALIAEKNSLKHICGVGYRKALEFLIKDYIISKDNNLKDTIEKANLGKCIKEYITNERIKEISKRATWLGNDETHYVRKWIDKDISDLKMLIDLTIHWIEAETRSDQLILAMPE